MYPGDKLFEKQPTVVTLTILGPMAEERNKLVLMKNYVDQDDGDNICGDGKLTIKLELSTNSPLNIVIGFVNDTTSGSLLRASCLNSNIFIFCYDEFRKEDLQEQYEAISELINEDETICLAGLKNGLSLVGEKEAIEYANKMGWQHAKIELNDLDQVNQFFQSEISRNLAKRKFNEEILEEDFLCTSTIYL